MRNSTTDRSLLDRDVVPVYGCHNVFSLDAALPHTRARAPSRQLVIAECRCELLLPILCGVRVPYKLYCNNPDVCSSPAW